MHKSRLTQIIIDCQGTDLVTATRFWSAALGRAASEGDPTKDRYVMLAPREGEPLVGLQHVGHDSRVHLDIETDDVEAEATRLEALGAKRVEKINSWIVMQAPTGQKFCVVRPQSELLERLGNRW